VLASGYAEMEYDTRQFNGCEFLVAAVG